MREVREETGLKLVPPSGIESPSDISIPLSKSGSDISIGWSRCLGLWESVYPPALDQGTPIRHHVVVYLNVSVTGLSISEIEKRIELDPRETDASIWVGMGWGGVGWV